MDEVDLEELLNQAVKEIETNISLDENNMNKVLSTVSDEELDLTTLDRTMEEVAMEAPTTEEPAMHEPAMHEPAMHEPAMQEPAMHEPAMHEPAMHKPTLHEPAIQEPAMHEHATQEPAPQTPDSLHNEKTLNTTEHPTSTDSSSTPDIENILSLLNSKNSNSETIQNLIKSLSNSNTQTHLPPEVNSKLKELATLLKVYKPVVVEKVKGKNEAPKDLVDVARHTFGFFLDKMVDMLDEQEN